MVDDTLEDKLDQLHDDVRTKNREDRSVYMWLWRGILFGIGSTVGVALIFYIFLLIAHQLVNVPILGSALQQFEPLLKQTAETRVPNVQKLLPAITTNETAPPKASETPQNAPSASSKTVTDSAGFYTLSVASDWTVSKEQSDVTTPEVLSTVILQSPEWQAASQQNMSPEGMYVSLSVLRDAHADFDSTDSEVDGEPAVTEHSENNGLNTDTIRWNHNDRGYLMTATYNPSTYDGPGKLIESMLISFKFTK